MEYTSLYNLLEAAAGVMFTVYGCRCDKNLQKLGFGANTPPGSHVMGKLIWQQLTRYIFGDVKCSIMRWSWDNSIETKIKHAMQI